MSVVWKKVVGESGWGTIIGWNFLYTEITLTSTVLIFCSQQGLSTTPVQYGHRHSLTLDYHHRDDDQDSVSSMASNTSSLCEHAHFARNGTTYSARKMKYIVHCASHSDQDGEYLTPTQRANRSIRRLRVSTVLPLSVLTIGVFPWPKPANIARQMYQSPMVHWD